MREENVFQELHSIFDLFADAVHISAGHSVLRDVERDPQPQDPATLPPVVDIAHRVPENPTPAVTNYVTAQMNMGPAESLRIAQIM